MGVEPVDATAWPVVVVTVDGSVGAEAARAAVEALDDVLGRRQRLGFVFDYQRGVPEAQEIVSRWLAGRVDQLERLVAGAVTVVRPASIDHVRSMIETGAFPMPFPSWATVTVAEGVAWVRERLVAEGTLPGATDPG
jgi:hypothetical protein